MTVTYTAEVATCRGLGCFLKLLIRWKGSIYKLVWIDLILFLSIYYGLNITYRFALNEDGKRIFEYMVSYCYGYGSLIPLSFVLGFYVNIVMTRWWNQYATIPSPDPLAIFVSATIHGKDDIGRVMRRTIMRYVCLCITMTFTMISPRVKKRLPTLNDFLEIGLLHPSEKKIFENLNSKFPKYSKQWLPLVWASRIVKRARKEGRIRDDFAVKTIIDELNKIREQCGLLLDYDLISIPLVYTQVVTLAVYTYFLTTILGHQWVKNSHYQFDLYFPVFTILQFFFYMGWLKVAETMINPFGDDDDDFDLNWMIDRNIQLSYVIVDAMHNEDPDVVTDQYWKKFIPDVPYTPTTEEFKHPKPSTDFIHFKNKEAKPSLRPLRPRMLKRFLSGDYGKNKNYRKGKMKLNLITTEPSKIMNQVIEVDERINEHTDGQALLSGPTDTSMHYYVNEDNYDNNEYEPTSQKKSSSAPEYITTNNTLNTRYDTDERLEDEFSKLKKKREEERFIRLSRELELPGSTSMDECKLRPVVKGQFSPGFISLNEDLRHSATK